ncbi:GNAT family N-acetyltransferase [Georgenia sp. AZ-5]|uniref:GNAT family N-acetyltransferase n=1 Tax=Georgenia sp. AZ-5 TaxID=3367526 RepID=UPI003754BE83
MDVVVSRAGAAEWRTVREVRLRALAADPAAFGSTLAREQAFGDDVWRGRAGAGRTFLARRGGAVVGIASYYVEEGREDERQLVSMWVAPEARGSGIAPLLVGAVRDAAAAEGAAALTLFVAQGNEAARRLYERLGFRPTGEIQALPSDPSRGEERYALPLAAGRGGTG